MLCFITITWIEFIFMDGFVYVFWCLSYFELFWIVCVELLVGLVWFCGCFGLVWSCFGWRLFDCLFIWMFRLGFVSLWFLCGFDVGCLLWVLGLSCWFGLLFMLGLRFELLVVMLPDWWDWIYSIVLFTCWLSLFA